MKQLEVCENAEPRRGRKVYDQTIYVSALERGLRDRSPRPIEPLPDRIELKICPQRNHRGRMNYYRARSIPELCRITLTPSGENSFHEGEMKEVYFTQYTHSFEHEIEKPHIVAWKQAFEDGDVAHKDSKLCIVNSPVGSKPGGYPERRRSAPPGSFVFNYDALDMPEPVHRRSKSLGLSMDNLLDFDQMDSQVGASAGGIMNTNVGKSTGGNLRPLAHEMITAQKVEQVESVDSSFWDDTFNSFNVEENHSNSTNNGVRNGDVTGSVAMTGDVIDGVATDGVTTDGVTTDGVTTDGVTTDGVTTDVFGRVASDIVSQNGFNLRYDGITHDNDRPSTEDPTKQALSLINTLRSSVKKPDSKTFLRSVHETESRSKNRQSLKNKSKKPAVQDISYRNKVPLGTLPQESPQKVTPRIVSIPHPEFAHRTVRPYDVSPRKSLRHETSSRKNLPQEVTPRKNEPQEDFPRASSQLNTGFDPELKRKYTSKFEATTMITRTAVVGTDHYQEANIGVGTNRMLDTDQSYYPEQSDHKDRYSQPHCEKKPTSEKPKHDEGYYQRPSTEVGRFKTPASTVHNNTSKPTSRLSPELEETDANEDYYQQPNSEAKTFKTPARTVYNNTSKPTSKWSPELEATDPNEEYYEQPNLEARTFKILQTTAYNSSSKQSSKLSPELEGTPQNEDYYQQPNSEARTFKTPASPVYNDTSKPTSRLSPELEETDANEDYYQQPNSEAKTFKTPASPVYNDTSKPTSKLSPELEETDANEEYYQQPNSKASTFRTPASSVYTSTSKQSTKLSPELEATDPNEDYYQQPNSEARTFKTPASTVYNDTSKPTTVKQSPELAGTEQYQNNEEHYQQPNSRMRTLKTVEINQTSHSRQVESTVYSKRIKSNKTSDQLTFEEEKGYYQQPNVKVRNVAVQHRPLRNGDVRSNDSKLINEDEERPTPDEPYYQQPTLQGKTKTAQSYPNEIETNESLYQEPNDLTLSSTKCPLDQDDSKDYKKPLPEIPQKQNTNEIYYEIPKDTTASSMKCPLDQKPAEGNGTGDVEQLNDHVYEQVDFPEERIYEEYNYETMKPPQSRLDQQPQSLKHALYEQPDRNFYENFKVAERPSHVNVGYVAVKAPQRKNKTDEVVYKQPKPELSSSVPQEKITRSEVPAVLRKAQVVSDNEKRNVDSTSYSVDGLKPAVNYNEHTGSQSKQTDTTRRSASSLRPTNEVKKELKSNSLSSQVVYTSEGHTMKSIASNTSLARLDQSDGRMSEGSPKSRSTSSQGDLLPQKPEVEVLDEAPETRDGAKANKTQDEEVSQPSIYSKASRSKASQSNTSLARFSSFNSEASYKRRLTSAWIEQQRMNFRKQVSRESSLRRTKSVEFLKERAPSEDTADHQLKHSKSELSLEQLSLMYNPFEDKYFEANPNKHRAKVVHASPSQVFTRAKSLTDRKVKESRSVSQLNTSPYISQDSFPITQQDPKDTNHENQQQNLSMEGTLSSTEQRRQLSSSSKKPIVRPKSADVSGFDLRTSNDEPRNFSVEEKLPRQDEMVPHEVHASRRPRVRPKSADVSGFDVSSYNDEPTLKQSKSEVSVDQLKAMYDPYDQNTWFSPDPALQDENQSHPRQDDVTLDEVVHRRTRSEPESQLDGFKNGRKQPESELRKTKVENAEAEPVKSITKLDSQSVLVLNVVQPPKNAKFQRNPARKSTGSIISARAKEIENENRLTITEMENVQKESMRTRSQTTGDDVRGKTTLDGKPVEKLRARYINGGERSSVRYLSKSTDELTLTDRNETLTPLQAQPTERPAKTPKKDSGFRNFFGKIRRAKSEPNLDKNFNVLDIDSDHGGKRQISEKSKDDQENFHETSPRNSQDKVQNSSKNGQRSWPFYPNFKNFKKNFSKSKQNKADSSFNDSGTNSGRDMVTSQEFPESSVTLQSDIKREKVELTESQVDVVRPQNIPTTDSSASLRTVDKSTSQRKEPSSIVQVNKETKPTSPTSPVTSPRSARKRFFSGGNRIAPVTVTNVESEKNLGGIIVERSSAADAQNVPDKSVKQDLKSRSEMPAKSGQTRSESDSDGDKVRYPSSPKQSKDGESQERTQCYRVTEVTSRTTTSRETVSDDSRFVDSFSRREDLNSTPDINTTAANKNSTAFITGSVTAKPNNEEDADKTQKNVELSGQRNAFHKNVLTAVNDEHWKTKHAEHQDTVVDQGRDSTNNGLESKQEELNTKESKESKRRSFFGTKLFTSSGKTSSSQSKTISDTRMENKSSIEEGSSGMTEDVNTSQDMMMIEKNKEQDNSKTVSRGKSRETTSKKIDRREKEDKEKHELGTRIKGLITKVLPQKDKNSAKEEITTEETIQGKTGQSSDERNSLTTVVSVTRSSDKRISNQRASSDNTTKARRTAFVVRHLGESDSEKTRASEEEGIQKGAVEQDPSSKTEQQTSYSLKVKHMGDSRTVKTEKVSVKQSDTTQRDLERNEIGRRNAGRSFNSRDTVQANGLQDEIIVKTNVVDNVEAFHPVLDFFENAFNDNEESKDDKDDSEPARLGTPVGRLESSGMMRNGEMYPEKSFGVSRESEARRYEKQFGMGQESGARNMEQIKGFTMRQIKSSNVVLNKSIEDLDAVAKDQEKNSQTYLKHQELITKQDHSRNTRTQITQSKISVDKEADRESTQDDQNTTENQRRDVDQQQLKYVEKVMVSVHRGASEVKRLVQDDSFETSSVAESCDLYSYPVPKPLEHVRQSSGNVGGNRNMKVVLSYEMAGERATMTHSSFKKDFGNGPTNDNTSSAVPKPWQHVRSEEDNAEIVVTRDMHVESLPRFNSDTTRQTQVVKMKEGWGHVIEEFVVKNTAETTNTLNDETNDDSGRTRLNEEQMTEENTLKQLQPKNSFTPIQNSSNTPFSSGGSQTLTRSSGKSLDVVDKTDGTWVNKTLDSEETKSFSTSRTEATAPGKLIPKPQSTTSTSNSLNKTTEVKFTSNFKEQQRQSTGRTITSVQQQNETGVSNKITRPKSSLYKDAKKNTAGASTFHDKATRDVTVSPGKGKYESKHEMLNDVSKKNEKPKPPPVLPKPKRTKGKEISPVQIGEVRHDVNQERKPVGFLNVQNNNHSFVAFQSFQENTNGTAVRGEQMMSSQKYQAGGISQERFVSSRVTNTERRGVSSSVTMKQFRNETIASNETFKKLEKNKEKTSSNGKQRKQRGTTASETSEDLAVRLQRLLCGDDSMSEPEDSSVTHEISSAVYSEDSEFDTNLMQRRYRSLEKARKIPATAKIPRSSHISMDESSDEEVFRSTKFDYKMHSKTL